MKNMFTLILGTILSFSTLKAQDMPVVFELGTQEVAYEKLNEMYSQSLLEASNGDIKMAFDNWLHMMGEMEAYAKKIRFDIKGIKLWLHVFWNEDGRVAHIGYLLRPESRYIDAAEMGAFLKTFMDRYEFPQKSTEKFSHYTGASFPVYSEKAGE